MTPNGTVELPTVITIAPPTSSPTGVRTSVPNCLGNGLTHTPAAGFGLPGKIVYQDGNEQGLYAVGGVPLAHSQLSVPKTQEDVVFGFSPDGKWLAYAPVQYATSVTPMFETPSLVMLSADNVKVEHTLDVSRFKDELEPPEHFSGVSRYGYWMNKELLYVILDIENPNGTLAGSSAKLYDPSTGQWQESLLRKLSGWRTGAEFAFSPDLTLALYELESGVVLRDLNQDRKIWSDVALDTGHGTIIRWAPNGAMVAVANIPTLPEDWRIRLVSRDGSSVKTILDSAYPAPTPAFLVYFIGWSPDGRFLGIVTQEDVPTIYIYDTTSDEYRYRCPLPSYRQYAPETVWSPDSAYVAFAAPVLHLPLQVLNVHDGIVTEVTQDAMAVGWTNKWP